MCCRARAGCASGPIHVASRRRQYLGARRGRCADRASVASSRRGSYSVSFRAHATATIRIDIRRAPAKRSTTRSAQKAPHDTNPHFRTGIRSLKWTHSPVGAATVRRPAELTARARGFLTSPGAYGAPGPRKQDFRSVASTGARGCS